MRNLALLAVIAVVAAGCAEKEEETALPADTASVAPAPAGLTGADLAGTWETSVRPADKDSVLNTYKLIATSDNDGWKIVFPGRTDTVAVDVQSIVGDSVNFRFGPYSSALRKDVQVVSEVVSRVQNGTMTGNLTAHYAVSTPDSVVQLRIEGTRTP